MAPAKPHAISVLIFYIFAYSDPTHFHLQVACILSSNDKPCHSPQEKSHGVNAVVNEYAADSCALECKDEQEAAQAKLTTTDSDGIAKLKVKPFFDMRSSCQISLTSYCPVLCLAYFLPVNDLRADL